MLEMDLNIEQPAIGNENVKVEVKAFKRKIGEKIEHNLEKKIKNCEASKTQTNNHSEDAESFQNVEVKDEIQSSVNKAKVPNSPKKRLQFSSGVQKLSKEKFIYGNYSQYYGYRNKDKSYIDIRLQIFGETRDIFNGKQILDIGCNSGFITIEVAKQFEAKSIIGLDIDKSLINQATKNLTKLKKKLPMDNEFKRQQKFPFNISFVHGNYVLKDDVLLEIEKAQFDVILCLSITKWIQLNFGDQGLKQAFKRMFLQLNPQGKLILEAQPFDNYGRRKKMTDTIHKNFKEIKLFPKNFTEYLLSSEVGFSKVELMGVPDHCTKGFKRPIQIFSKTI